jgi:hypothetical protein
MRGLKRNRSPVHCTHMLGYSIGHEYGSAIRKPHGNNSRAVGEWAHPRSVRGGNPRLSKNGTRHNRDQKGKPSPHWVSLHQLFPAMIGEEGFHPARLPLLLDSCGISSTIMASPTQKVLQGMAKARLEYDHHPETLHRTPTRLHVAFGNTVGVVRFITDCVEYVDAGPRAKVLSFRRLLIHRVFCLRR